MEQYGSGEAGASARAHAEKLRAEQSTFTRIMTSLFDSRTDERAWRLGAIGEEKVGKSLAKLPEGWAVIHDLTIGSGGANLDHLVIGPPGVFTLNTKYVTGSLTVYERAILHNGQKTAYLPKARAEARKAREALSGLVAAEFDVTPVIVLVGKGTDVRGHPGDVRVMHVWALRRWLKKRPHTRLGARDIRTLAQAACRPAVWGLDSDRSSSAGVGIQQPRGPAPDGLSEQLEGCMVSRWRRYGKDRLYVNTPDGRTLGWLDLQTDDLVVEDEQHHDLVRAAVTSWQDGSANN